MRKSRIRVLHIDSQYGWRGGQQQAVYLIEGMVNRGYETGVICQPGSDLEKYCRSQKLPVYPLRMRSELDLFAAFSIATLCRKSKFNILHLHAAHAHSLGIWTKVFFRKLKIVVTRRVDFSINNSILSKIKYKTSLNDRIVCISNQVKKVLVSDGVPEHMLTIIYSGIDTKKFSTIQPPPDFKKSLGIPEHHCVIGTVAAMVDHKDYPNLLNAAKVVLDKYENVSFCAVGGGELQQDIIQIAESLHLGPRFIFAGWRKDIGNFLKTFDIFVLSSHLEGLGTSILDAQSVGLPVVACESGGIPEMVQDGYNGYLVPRKQPKALANAIGVLVENEQKRKSIGTAAKESVVRFSIDVTIGKYLQLYDDIL